MDNNMLAAAASSASSAGLFSPATIEMLKTWVGYIGVLGASIIVAYAGIRKALKDIAKGEDPKQPGGHPGGIGFVGGTIMETTTLLMWSESNREVAEKAGDVIDAIKINTEAINRNTDTSAREMGELRHQIERLRDKMP